MRSWFRPISAIAMGFTALILLSGSFAGAQLSSATINGVVVDPSGAAIPGAKVTLRGVANGEARDTLTNQSGNYVFVSVEPGSYDIEVAKQGFNTATQNTVTLYVSQTATFNFRLAVGTQVQQVTVSAARRSLRARPPNWAR
jgi:Carboxypeptidase regulatory-like domain